jgi:hypothetical protein
MEPNRPCPTRNPVPSTPSEHGVHRRVVRALATRPLTGVVLLDYGIRHAVASLAGIAGWALTLAAGALLSFCAIVRRPRAEVRRERRHGPRGGRRARGTRVP